MLGPSSLGKFAEGEDLDAPLAGVGTARHGRRDVSRRGDVRLGGLTGGFRTPCSASRLVAAPAAAGAAALWLGVVYLGSLLALLVHSFYSIDEFSGFIVYEFSLSTYAELLHICRTSTLSSVHC